MMLINLAYELVNKQLVILLKSTDFTMMLINLAYELVNKQLVILLIFVNNKHFVNAVTMGKVSRVDKMRMQTMREQNSKQKQ